jgi:hypothetical protein
MCYTNKCLDVGTRGVLLLNAISSKQYFYCGQSALRVWTHVPPTSKQRWQSHGGRFVMSKLRARATYVSPDEKTCSKCNEVRLVGEFSKNSKAWDGLKSYCKKCQSENDRRRQKTRRRPPRPNSKESIEKRYRAPKRKFVELAGGKCQRCGYNEFVSALQFHHVNPQDKKAQPSRLTPGNFNLAYEELDKCVLLCRNCHMAFEYGNYWRAEFIKRDGLGYTIK